MSDLCRTCGIRRDVDGLCQCVGVLYARIRELEARPRPVAEWGAPGGATYLYVGRAVLGYVLTSQSGSESAVCGITGEHFRGYDARAWLVERVRAAGFDVQETKR